MQRHSECMPVSQFVRMEPRPDTFVRQGFIEGFEVVMRTAQISEAHDRSLAICGSLASIYFAIFENSSTSLEEVFLWQRAEYFTAMSALCSALTMRFSVASRKWMGGSTIFSTVRPVVSTEPVRFELPAPRSRQSDYSTSVVPTVQRGNGNQGRRAFAGYTFYKGKGAMSMNPGKPIFKIRDTGDFELEREGTMFLDFAPALGPRQYDWSRKQVIALSVLELGTLVGLSMGETCEFFHDPFMGKSDAGKIRKVLKVEPMSDQTGLFFNLYVSNKLEGLEAKISIALTRAEYSVLRSSANFMIPYLMGWHTVVDPSKLDDLLSDGTESSPFSLNEWQK